MNVAILISLDERRSNKNCICMATRSPAISGSYNSSKASPRIAKHSLRGGSSSFLNNFSILCNKNNRRDNHELRESVALEIVGYPTKNAAHRNLKCSIRPTLRITALFFLLHVIPLGCETRCSQPVCLSVGRGTSTWLDG